MTFVNADASPGPSQRLGLYALIACGLIVLAPLASGARGVDATLGRTLLTLVDGGLVLMFARAIIVNQRPFDVLVFSLIVFSIIQGLTFASFPGLDTVAQGIRKSFLVFMAIGIGRHIHPRDRATVYSCIVFALFYVCVYGIKQRFSFDAFDHKLLSAQSADIYTNMIGGKLRSISFLSSGFHLGAAACVLAAFAVFSPDYRAWKRIILYIVAAGACYSSLTRTFWILIAAVPIVAFASRDWVRATVVSFLLLLVGLVAEAGFGTFTSLAAALTEDTRLLGRGHSYTNFVEFFAEKPMSILLGFGPGSAGSGLSNDFARAGAVWNEPHNVFLKYSFELGALAGAAAIGMLIYACLAAYKSSGERRSLVLSLSLVFAIAGLTITSVEVWPVNWFFGLAIGMAMTPASQYRWKAHRLRAAR